MGMQKGTTIYVPAQLKDRLCRELAKPDFKFLSIGVRGRSILLSFLELIAICLEERSCRSTLRSALFQLIENAYRQGTEVEEGALRQSTSASTTVATTVASPSSPAKCPEGYIWDPVDGCVKPQPVTSEEELRRWLLEEEEQKANEKEGEKEDEKEREESGKKRRRR